MGSLQVVPPGKPRSYYSHIFKLLINSQIVSSVVIKFMKFPSILAFLRVCIRNGWWILSVPKIRKANLRRQRVKSREWSPRRYYATDLRLAAAAAAAAAKSLQLCPTLCNPIDGSPPGSPIPGILQARTLEWVAMSFSDAWKWKVKVKLPSHVWLSRAPLSMGFSRQEYWSGVPLPSPI